MSARPTTEEIPTGAVIVGASFVREGDAMPTTGTVSLFIDDERWVRAP